MFDVVRHLGTTLRSLARQPGMAAIVVLTFALGIGASTALFAYLAAIVWPVIEAPEPERVVYVSTGTPEEPQGVTSYPDFLDLQRKQTAVTQVAGFGPFGSSVGHGGTATFAWGQIVSGNYFSLFGARPHRGRLLQPADDRPGAEPVLVLNHFFWKGALGGDPGVVGRPIRLNGHMFTVAGIAAPGFAGPGLAAAVYIPMVQSDRVIGVPRLEDRERRWITVLGRLNGSVTLEAAQAALDAFGRSLDAAAPVSLGERRMGVALATTYRFDPAEDPFLLAARVLMAAALVFLLLGCANVANLLLARATARQRELGIRASLGASRRRLVGSVLGESFVLCAAGGLLGLQFAALLGRRIEEYVRTPPPGLGNWGEGSELIRLDARVFAFGLGVALACGLLCGLAPVLQILRGDLLAAVKSGSNTATAAAAALTPRKLLVVAQVGLSVVLLLGGSLLVRTLRNALTVDPGFSPHGLHAATVFVPRSASPAGDAGEVYGRVLEGARQVSGVASVSMAHAVPLAGFAPVAQAAPEGEPSQEMEVAQNIVGPDFFATMGIPILQGRALDHRDRQGSAPAVVVSRELARRLWKDASPVGRQIRVSLPTALRPGEAGPVFEVVGVCQDVRIASVVEPPGPVVYFPYGQKIHPRMTLLVRSALPPGALSPVLRDAVRSAHPDVTILDMASLPEQIERSLAAQRMYAEVAGLFGLLGLGVAVLGLFGLLSYTVSLRVREFGIRMAIGARPGDVLELVLRQGMGLVAAGVLLGVAGALGVTRLLKALLFGVEATDPLLFVAVPAGLALVALLACWLPARRAARLDPLVALKGT
jgi:predicted permease